MLLTSPHPGATTPSTDGKGTPLAGQPSARKELDFCKKALAFCNENPLFRDIDPARHLHHFRDIDTPAEPRAALDHFFVTSTPEDPQTTFTFFFVTATSLFVARKTRNNGN